jgi:archaemetzincin
MWRSVLLGLLLLSCHRGTPRGPIALVPIGPVSPDVLAYLQRELPPLVHRDVVIAAEIPRLRMTFDGARRQYRGDALLDQLARFDVPAAVLALPRLRDSFRGHAENVDRFHERALKEATHELGHTFGFTHCENPTCVMHFSNAIGDTDRKSAHFCRNEIR